MKNIFLLLFSILLLQQGLAVPVIYKDSYTDITGTWIGNGTLNEITGNSPYEGTHHYQFTYSYTGYWAGFGLNMDNWGNGPVLDFTGYSHIRLAYRGLAAGEQLTIVLRNDNISGNAVVIGSQTGAYTVVDLSMTALTVGTNVSPSAITEIDINVSSNIQTGSGTVYLDAIELVNVAGGASPASSTTWARANSISMGVNTSNWLEAYWLLPFGAYPETNKYTFAKVSALRNAGFDIFRLPVIFERLGSISPPYTIDFNQPAFALVDSMILWADILDFKLIIDNHHGYDLTDANYNTELPRLLAVWQQITQEYGYLDPEQYFFEIYNEPTNQISNAHFRIVAEQLVDQIRAEESQTHSVFVGATQWNSGGYLQTFEPLSDPDIIYTFHTYDPFAFTHQGFSWTSPPYLPARTFPQAGEQAAIQQLMAGVKAWSDAYDVPASLGEFGASTEADATSRCNWIQTMMSAVNANGFSWMYWDAISPDESFGFYTSGIIDHAHVIPCFETAMGLYPVFSIALEAIHVDCNNHLPVLEWSAYTDGAGHTFEIERSNNGFQWEKAGMLAARSGHADYAFTDPVKAAYYRLRMTDPDGKTTYSLIQPTPCATDIRDLGVFPNPAQTDVQLNWPDQEDAIRWVGVYDISGRIIFENTIPANITRAQYSFSAAQLPPGMYRVVVHTDEGIRAESPLIVTK